MDTLPPLQRGKGIFVNLTLDGICRLHLSGGHAKISLRIYEEAARWGDKDRSAAPKKAGDAMEKRQKTSLTMCLVAIGIVYGDIGTSPLYVMKSILEGNGGITQINESFIVGALSLIIWTITLLTTIKYVLIAMKADNHGEGGIFSLYSLVRSCGKWLIVPAMLGGAALLADGVLTPAVTVTSAVEGLRSIAMMDRLLGGRQTGVIIITLCIIASLFAVQHAGTSRIGKAFGPVMLVWFLFLGATGAMNIFSMPQVLRAFNPAHAVELLVSPYNKLGFMILGSVCTRNCRFCNVTTGQPLPPDPEEPMNVAKAAKKLNLRHVVLTCSTRDDLPDGGAEQFAKCVRAIREVCPGTTVETLISDMKGDHAALDTVIAAHPEVLNHNVETVRELQSAVRPQARYERSLEVLRYCKEQDPTLLTKTGFMVGLGETEEQIDRLMDDILETGCDILTIGQYLQPTPQHYPLARYATPEDFARWKELALAKGFRHVASAPLARSSYKAWEALEDVHDLY